MISSRWKSIGPAVLVFAFGFNLSFVQGFAWAAMLADNLRAYPLSEAVVRTFDGKHPCPICRAVDSAGHHPSRPGAASVSLKLEFPPPAAPLEFVASMPRSAAPSAPLAGRTVFRPPPAPPPRVLLF